MSRILSGKQEPKLRVAYDLAKFLGVSLDVLMDEDRVDLQDTSIAAITPDEAAILMIVRRLGTAKAMDRLLSLHEASESARAGRVRASRTQ